MNGHNRFGWAFVVAALLFGIAAAMIAYNVGVSDGVAAGGSGAAFEAARRMNWGHHGFGFGWIFFALAFWFLLARGACWGRRYGYGGPRGPYAYGPRDYPPAPDEMDEWHRRAHERMKEAPPADDSGRRG
jgi:hypothetical protein